MEQARGIVYIAVGAGYVRDAERSARFVRKQHPDLPICLFSDVPSSDPIFDITREITQPHRRSKLDCMMRTPFEKTLYLDNDTRVIGSIDEPFGLLDRYDLAACHVENRHPVSSATARLKGDGVEIGFTGFNSGVIYYKMNQGVRRFLEIWAEEFKRKNPTWDQPLMRECLWMSPEIKVIALPPEYNIRTLRGLLFRSANESEARLLHLPWYKSGDHIAWRFWRTMRTLRVNPCNVIGVIRSFFY